MKKNNSRNIKEIFKFILKYISKDKFKYLIAILLMIVTSILSLAAGYLNGLSIEKITTLEYKLAVLFLIIYFISNILRTFIHKYSNIILKNVSNNAMERISNDAFVKVGLMPSKAYEEKSSGELINRVTQDSTNIISNINNLVWLGTDILSAVIIMFYIFFNSKIIFLELSVYLIIFFLFSKKFMPIIKENEKNIKKGVDKVTSKVNESIRGVREIRALGIRTKVNDLVKKDLTDIFSKRREVVTFTEKYYSTVKYINSFIECLVYLTSFILLFKGLTTLTFVVALTWYIYRIMYVFESFSTCITSYQTLVVSAERLMEVIDNKLYDDIKFGKINKKVNGNIKLSNINFRYKETEDYVLKNLNLEIKKNEITALVGKSGNGKSTIFNLLLRYFDDYEGEITLDDINIKDFTEDSLSSNISIIRQDPFVFNLSIIDNFKIIDKKISLKKVREYTKLCELDDYIMSLPNKYNTILGEGGINLSGGQKQRLAIARALMKESKIILMDEATSALDNVNQEKIKLVMEKLKNNHTIVIVAHRLSTIKDADIIHLVEKGSISTSGTHLSLMKNSKKYKELYLKDETM